MKNRSHAVLIIFLCFPLLLSNLVFGQSIRSHGMIMCGGADSVSTIYADTAKKINVGKMEYYNQYAYNMDTVKLPYKIGHYISGTDTAFYFNGMKVGYYVDLNRGDEIHPHWISLGTFPRGYTFGVNYHYYQKKHSYFEAYVGEFALLLSGTLKIFSTGANYTLFFYRKEKPRTLYQSVFTGNSTHFYPGTPLNYKTRIPVVKNIHWGLQTGFSYDVVNGERTNFRFTSNDMVFKLMDAHSLAALAGITRFVSKCAQLSFGKDHDRILRGANFRRLSFAMTYYPLLNLESSFISAAEGIVPDPNSSPYNDFFGKPFGWRLVWDGRICFWSKRNFGITYRYGLEQTPYRQFGRNGLVPICAAGIFFNVGKNPAVVAN